MLQALLSISYVSALHCKQLCVFTFFRFGDHARALEGKIVGKFIKNFYEILTIKEHPLFIFLLNICLVVIAASSEQQSIISTVSTLRKNRAKLSSPLYACTNAIV
jgi:hypothetical protein